MSASLLQIGWKHKNYGECYWVSDGLYLKTAKFLPEQSRTHT